MITLHRLAPKCAGNRVAGTVAAPVRDSLGPIPAQPPLFSLTTFFL
ncbi:MAG: hypothetical protein LBD58_01710 [Treponema sp.]|nr:hypothetical protein [Treponema sp.]